MKFQRLDDQIELILEGEQPEELLKIIAKLSYETALPRGLGYKQAFTAPSEEACLEDCIEYKRGKPVLLLMDYINGLDCRTQVYEKNGKWFFDAYAFEQRGLNADQFLDGDGKGRAEEFLEKVQAYLK